MKPKQATTTLMPAGQCAGFPCCRTVAVSHLDAGVLADHACAAAGRIQQHTVNCVAANHPRQLPAVVVGQDYRHRHTMDTGHKTQTRQAGQMEVGFGDRCAGMCSRAAGWNN